MLQRAIYLAEQAAFEVARLANSARCPGPKGAAMHLHSIAEQHVAIKEQLQASLVRLTRWHEALLATPPPTGGVLEFLQDSAGTSRVDPGQHENHRIVPACQ